MTSFLINQRYFQYGKFLEEYSLQFLSLYQPVAICVFTSHVFWNWLIVSEMKTQIEAANEKRN